MSSARHAAVAFVIVLAEFACGCRSLRTSWGEIAKQQYQQAVEGMKADLSPLDSEHDGLDAFGPADARHLRAARAEMDQ